MRRVERNPILGVDLTTWALLGAGIWLVMSDQGQSVLRTVGASLHAPVPGVPTFPPGSPPGTGSLPSTTFPPGSPPGTGSLPSTAFRLRSISIGPGGPVTWQIEHAGPAGTYICGWEKAPYSLFCPTGNHNATSLTVEQSVSVNDDLSWTPYTVVSSDTVPFSLSAVDRHGYIRDARSAVPLVDQWQCAINPFAPW